MTQKKPGSNVDTTTCCDNEFETTTEKSVEGKQAKWIIGLQLAFEGE